MASSPARALDRAPEDLTYRSGASWAGGSIVYIGSRVSPPRPNAGQRVVLSHYFQAAKSNPRGFQFFVHLVDSASGQMVLNADHEIQGGALPLQSRPARKVIEDVHSFQMP